MNFFGHILIGYISSLEFVQGDVQQYESLPIGEKFTHVLHAATDSTLGPTLNPLQRYDQIVDGTATS